MTPDDLLQQGIAAFKARQKAEARDLLLQVVEQDERNEMAWLWLSGAVDTDAERLTCLENVLAINPDNGMAKRGIETLRKSSPGLVSADVPSRKDEVAVQPTEEPRTSVEFQSATPDEINNILQQAVTAIKSGEKERGKELLVEVLELDENNEAAWLWMTRCVADLDVKRECFERVLEINPDNQHAIKGLKRLDVLSKVKTPASPKHKAARKPTRLIVGAGMLVVIVVLVGIWWMSDSGLLQLETGSPEETDRHQEELNELRAVELAREKTRTNINILANVFGERCSIHYQLEGMSSYNFGCPSYDQEWSAEKMQGDEYLVTLKLTLDYNCSGITTANCDVQKDVQKDAVSATRSKLSAICPEAAAKFLVLLDSSSVIPDNSCAVNLTQ